jgi:hypothetical protein
MTSETPTAAELAARLDDAHRALASADAHLQRARHAAFLAADPGADDAEAAAETALSEAQKLVQRLEAALAEQRRLEGAQARADHLRGLETQEDVFLEHIAAAEAAGAMLEKALATYVKGYDAYTRAAIAVQQMAPALSDIRHDFTLDKPETLIGDELARVSAGGRHPPGTSFSALQTSDPTRLPPISQRIGALTGEWRSNIEAARAARGA